MRGLRQGLALVAAFSLAVAVCGCGGGEGSAPIGGAAEQAVVSSAHPLEGIDDGARVVALSHTAADLWLLAGGDLVGVTSDAADVEGIGEDVAVLGEAGALEQADVLALEPQLVIATDEVSIPRDVANALEAAGVPTLVEHMGSFDDYERAMAELTGATGRDDLYEAKVELVGQKVDEAIEHSFVEGRGSALVLRVGASGQQAAGTDDLAMGMLVDLGFTPVVEEAREVGAAEIAELAPDWVFVVFREDGSGPQEAFGALKGDAAWEGLAAVQQGHVVSLPQGLFRYAPDARWAEAYAYLSQVAHGAWA